MSAKLRSICLNFSVIGLFMLLFQVAHSQEKFTDAAAMIEQHSKRLKQDIVLVVATKDTIVFQKEDKAFGAVRGQAPLAYSSQWLTAALVMILVDEGKISLDDKVSQYIPAFASYKKGYVTIRHCLSHFTGIQAETNKVLKLFDKKKYANLEETIAGYVKKEIQANAGEAFRYNNMGPDIAGRVLEIVAKKKFDLLAQQKLLRPLGMRQTTFSTIDASAVSPSAGARGTAADYIRFLRMLLNGGMHNGQRILSESSVAVLRSVLTSVDNRKDSPASATGWEFALGAWAPGAAGVKEATVLTSPSFGGTTPVVDFCRGYAFMYLQKELTDEGKEPVAQQIKNVLDPLFPQRCR